MIKNIDSIFLDLSSLKLLCDLASESEDGGSLEIIRVQSLSLVGTALSPLIYDMDKRTSFNHLLEKITSIYEIFSKNRDLPEKIVILQF